MSARIVVLAVLFAGSSSTRGQMNGFDVIVDHEVSPQHPSTEVEVWAHFEPQYYAFAYSAFRVVTHNGGPFDEGVWSDLESVITGWGTSPGTLSDDGSDVRGVVAGQDLEQNIFPDPSNPILVWRGMWTTDDFAPRQLRVDTQSLWFDIWVTEDAWNPDRQNVWGQAWQSNPGFISIVPAPGSGAVAAAGLLAPALRRHRR